MAELLGVLFGEIIFLQQGDLLASAQPQQPRLLIFSDANVLNGIRGKCFSVAKINKGAWHTNGVKVRPARATAQKRKSEEESR